jgi:23S rRNA pseudouridine2605 synthase
MHVRLQKYLADAGVASRRASETIILEGRVEVNGRVVRQLGTQVDPARDRVRLDGAELKPKRKLYLVLNKPRGYLCSSSDPQGRRVVGDLLPPEWRHVRPVGRLDNDSEGLLFLTNDGQFSVRITHPRYGVRKVYRVIVEGRVDTETARRLEAGVTEGGEKLRAEKVRILTAQAGHSLLELTLQEGKKREIRRLFDALGFSVAKLQRVQIGPIKLGELPSGRWRTLTGPEINSLLRK